MKIKDASNYINFFERMKPNINTNQIAMDVTLSWNFSVLFAFALFLGDFDVV